MLETKEELISPQILSKRIKFSNDLSNLSVSVTTQDLTPRATFAKKLNNAQTDGESSESYFKK